MRLLLFCGNGRLTNTVGGAEKVFSEFANEFARRGNDVAAVGYETPGAAPKFPLDERVRYFNLRESNREPASFAVAKCWREATKPLRRTPLRPLFPNFYLDLKRAFVKPRLDAVLNEFRPEAVVFFFVEDAKTFFFRRPAVDCATIQMLHNVPNRSIPNPGPEDRAALDRCDVVQTLSAGFVPAIRRLSTSSVVVIPNVVPQFAERVDFDVRERAATKRVVCVARLAKRAKRQHLLIDAFAKVAPTRPDWRLDFFGSPDRGGRYRRRLERAIRRFGLEDRISLNPPTKFVKEELLKSDVFAFPSAYEGFGLALAEAQSLGLPTIGFRSAPAVNELIVDGENGFLVDDLNDFADKLGRLLDSKELRARFGADGKRKVAKFEASTVWVAWERLLNETVREKRRATGDVDKID